MKAFQLAQELGITEYEAEKALQYRGEDVRLARHWIESSQEHRSNRYGSELEAIWRRYSATNRTDIDGALALVKDLGLAPEDPHVLALVYELQAPEVGVFVREKYIDGWARLEATSLPLMKEQARERGLKMDSDPKYYAQVYRYCFRFNLQDGHKLLNLEIALAYWTLLLVPRYDQAADWVEFMKSSRHNVNHDTWNMALRFLDHLRDHPDLSDYDDTGSWPIVIDDFVEYLRGDTDQLAE